MCCLSFSFIRSVPDTPLYPSGCITLVFLSLRSLVLALWLPKGRGAEDKRGRHQLSTSSLIRGKSRTLSLRSQCSGVGRGHHSWWESTEFGQKTRGCLFVSSSPHIEEAPRIHRTDRAGVHPVRADRILYTHACKSVTQTSDSSFHLHLHILHLLWCKRLQGQGDLTRQSATAWGQTRLLALFLEISQSSVVFCSLLCVSILTCSDSSPSSFIALCLHLSPSFCEGSQSDVNKEEDLVLVNGKQMLRLPPPTSLPRVSNATVSLTLIRTRGRDQHT